MTHLLNKGQRTISYFTGNGGVAHLGPDEVAEVTKAEGERLMKMHAKELAYAKKAEYVEDDAPEGGNTKGEAPNLKRLKKPELLAYAAQLGLEVQESDTIADLIEAIEAHLTEQ